MNNYSKNPVKFLFNMMPFLMIGIVWYTFHTKLEAPSNDDLWFAIQLDTASLSEFLSARYSEWSSRLFIEAILVYLTRMNPMVWRILNTLVIMSIGYSIRRIFTPHNSIVAANSLPFIEAMMLLCFSPLMLQSAGYMATSLNYLWPVAGCCFSFLPLRILSENQSDKTSRLHPVQCIFLPFAILIAGSQEQTCAICLCGYLLVLIYYIFENSHNLKKILSDPVFILSVVIFLLYVVSIAIILLCPGNTIRKEIEIPRFYLNFPEVPMYRKVQQGFLNLMCFLYEGGLFLGLILLSCLLFVALLIRYNNIIYTAISVIPILLSILLGELALILKSKETIPDNSPIFLMQNNRLFTHTEVFSRSQIALETLIDAVTLIIIAYELYLLFKDVTIDMLITELILAASVASGIVIGFAPNIYASENRTAIPSVFGFIILCSRVLNYIYATAGQKAKQNSSSKSKLLFLTNLALLITVACIIVTISRSL